MDKTEQIEHVYDELGELEDREIFLVGELGVGADDPRLVEVRKAMRPIKEKLNELEGFTVYLL